MRNGVVKDRYELELTTGSHEAADLYVDALDKFLAQVWGSDVVLAES